MRKVSSTAGTSAWRAGKSWRRRRGCRSRSSSGGDHELTARLNREENRGRHWFWFNSEQFTLAWFREALNVSIRNAGERYTPVVHIELPLASSFAALGRTPVFHTKLNTLYTKLRETAGRFLPERVPEEFKATATFAEGSVAKIARHLDDALLSAHDPTRAPSFSPIAWQAIADLARPLAASLDKASGEVRAKLWSARSKADAEKERGETRPLEEGCWACDELSSATEALLEFATSTEATVANRPALLLCGEAGQGKTHLLCDVADRDMQEDRPRILLHGSHFTEGEPWGQVVRLLGLDCSTSEFLGALEAAGEAYKCRVLILIDALNEGPGRGIWHKHLAGMLERISTKLRIGLAVSVRSSYEDIVIPTGIVPDQLVRLVHQGFAEYESNAVHRYFLHYGIQPTTPLLVPEFSNPLFLKLFCQGVKGQGWRQVPLGIRGITAILDMLLDATNARLSAHDRMDFDRAGDPVRKATSAVVRLMAERGEYYIPRSVAVEAVNTVHPTQGHDNSLFRNLVSEGLLTENRWRTENGYDEVVSFAYERFADHLLAGHLLGQATTTEKVRRGLAPRGKLRSRINDEYHAERNAGLLEALAVQIPERVGKELFELAPHAAAYCAVRRGFVASLVWRAATAFSKQTFDKLNQLLKEGVETDEILNAIVTLSPVPSHPLNAVRLHAILSRSSMAERDAWWSTFLHREWSRKRAVVRLIEWTSGKSDLSGLPDEVVLLTGTTLTWCLTTSSRFLRDRATKALVRLHENKLELVPKLLERFWEIDEPYVVERLVAAAYGSAMRSPGNAGLRELALAVNEHVFVKGKLLPQLLTRDYARSLVQLAKHRGALKTEECKEANPPHRSEWPMIKIPAASTLEKIGEWRDNLPPEQWALRDLYSSVMGKGLSDFSTYIIGDMSEWSSVQIGQQPSKPVKEQVANFIARLSVTQKEAVEGYQNTFKTVELIRHLDPKQQRKYFKRTFTTEELDAEVPTAEEAVRKSLRRKPTERTFFETVVKPFTENPYRFRRNDEFDGEMARRWMFQRILDYGWTTERFGEFDREVNRWSADRNEHKAERIGKKYQWIAYRELLARLSDNFYLRLDRFNEDAVLGVCQGPWEIGGGFKRDIDPSVLIRSTLQADNTAGHVWWSPVGYTDWHVGGSELGWLKSSSDLPAVETLLSVVAPDGSNWLVLDTHLEWRASPRPGRKKYDQPQQMIWYIIRSYLVRKADAAKFYQWAKKRDFMGRWMPKPRDIYHGFLGECYWSPAFQSEIEEESMAWQVGRSAKIPCEVVVTAFDHLTESSGLDCSLDDSVRVALPVPMITQGMGLRMSAQEGDLVDSTGRVIAKDPSVTERGPGALLVRREEFLRFLQAQDLELVWTLLSEKRRIGGHGDDSLGWLQTSGAYRVAGTKVEGDRWSEYRTSAR